MFDSWRTTAQDFLQRLPLRTMSRLVGVWVGLAVLVNILFEAGFQLDVPRYFPISEFYGARLHLAGLPFAILFLIVFFLALKRVARCSGFQVWLIGLVLILLGNLAQGSFDAAFYLPFQGHGGQYYYDAIQIANWQQWLREFNEKQLTLQDHSRTHPPFAVLLHYFIFELGQRSLFVLSSSFILLSSLSIILVWQILRALDLPQPKAAQLTLCFSVIPAVNIYSAVSLEGVTAAGCALFLLGVVKTIEAGTSFTALLFVVAGFVLANSLTFAGTFLALTALLIGWQQFQFKHRKGVLIVLLAAVSSSVLLYLIMRHRFGYDHLAAFLSAARYENPQGFQALHAPLEYVLTRLEGISEIALFLSLGVLAMLFHSEPLPWRQRGDASAIVWAALAPRQWLAVKQHREHA